MTNDVRYAVDIANLEADERACFLGELGSRDRLIYERSWHYWARKEQLAPPGHWSTWLIMAGRGFGKTRAGAEWVRAIAEADGEACFALVGANYAETRKVMVEGESGLLSIAAPDMRPDWQPSLKRLQWPNGARAFLYSASEPEGLRGPQHSHSWCDEIAKWFNNMGQAEATWDNLKMGMRIGQCPQIAATTTPKPVALIRKLVRDENIIITRGRTIDNIGHLPTAFITAIYRDYQGSRLGRQELEGELLAELEGALWTRAMIENSRRDRTSTGSDKEMRGEDAAGLNRIIIGVDPPASQSGDACGIIVTALRADRKAVVLADHSVERASPETWAKAVAEAAACWRADRVIAEANQGGLMVKSVLHAADINLPVSLVHATRGKVVRAEPIAALYEAGRVVHQQPFPRLEDELCGLLIGGGYAGPGRSPDRADALVYALSELMLRRRRIPRLRFSSR
ncbi:MAG: terminase family protein [Parasphingorhabdus sp.]|uniref:DNA-packaging protein n=1 Tax=Parasphingorhabdus sp. TaxID=2709688 RepID=UPI00329834CA